MDRFVIKSTIRGNLCTTMSNNLGNKQEITSTKSVVSSGGRKSGVVPQTSIKLAISSNKKIQINGKTTKILQENNGFLKISSQNDHKLQTFDDQLFRILNTELDEPLRLSLSPLQSASSFSQPSSSNINKQNDNQRSQEYFHQNSPSSLTTMKSKATSTKSNKLSSLMGGGVIDESYVVDENMPPHKLITFSASSLLISSSSLSSTSSSYQEMATEISSKSPWNTPVDNNLSDGGGGGSGINSEMAGSNQNNKMNPTNNRLLDKPSNYSPSAFSRMRAIQALRSPDKNKFFDVPSEEQDLISDEERRLAANFKPKTIKDVMKDVVVYVEVRTGADNRSDGIKTVISQLGAKVNDRLLRNTTHVIFKGGLQSTYNKAKNWNIPIVSILWIEACRTSLRLVDPTKFVISDIEIYENPELHKKIRRQKSMQPNAEEKRYNRKPTVSTTVSSVNFDTATSKTHQTQSGSKIKLDNGANNNNHIRIPRKPKDNLPEIFNTFAKNFLTTIDSSDNLIPNAKEPRLLQIIRESPYVTNKLNSSATKLSNDENVLVKNKIINTDAANDDGDDDGDDDSATKYNAKRSLFQDTLINDSMELDTDDCNLLQSFGDSNKVDNILINKKKNTPQKIRKTISTSKKSSSRRHTTFVTPISEFKVNKISIENNDNDKFQTPRKVNDDLPSMLLANSNMDITTPIEQNSRYGTRSSTRRQTLYISRSMDITNESIVTSKESSSLSSVSTPAAVLLVKTPTSINRRRTMLFSDDKSKIFDNKTIEETPPVATTVAVSVNNNDNNNLSKFIQNNNIMAGNEMIVSSSARKQQNPSNITPLHYSVLSRKPKKQIEQEKNENLLLSPIPKDNHHLPLDVTDEKTKSPVIKSSNRRRTLFTPNQLVELNRSNTKTEIRDQLCNSITGSPTIVAATVATAATAGVVVTNNTNVLSQNKNDTNKSNTSALISNTTKSLENLSTIESSTIIKETEQFTTLPMGDCDKTPPLPSTSHLKHQQINNDYDNEQIFNKSTPIKKRRTIFDEYNRTKSFSSTRKPPTMDVQKTFYDLSMEIIGQRIENINRLASERKNRSVSESDINLNDTITDLTGGGGDGNRDKAITGGLNTINNIRSTPHLPTTSTSSSPSLSSLKINNYSKTKDQNLPLVVEVTNKNNSNNKSSSHSPEIAVKKISLETESIIKPTPPKRRKLFSPNTFISSSATGKPNSPAPPPPSSSSSSISLITAAVTKTDHDSNLTKTDNGAGGSGSGAAAAGGGGVNLLKTNKPDNKHIKIITSTTINSKMIRNNIRRRTTMEFESPKLQSQTTTQRQFQQQKRLPKTSSPFLAATNMHKSQINIIKEAIDQLGKFEYNEKITNRTTHLISYEPLRTIKLLQGIIRGVWIVNFDWILDSRKCGKWLLEESYEERNFSRAISMCRTERQAFGPTYKLDLFSDIGGKLYVSSLCKCTELSELILSCGGRITNNKKNAKFIICDKWRRGTVEEKEDGAKEKDPSKEKDVKNMADNNYNVDTNKQEILVTNRTNKNAIKITAPLIHSSWILDSICIAKIKNIHEYILKKE